MESKSYTVKKAYHIPIQAPQDLLQAYQQAQKQALHYILQHTTATPNGKLHLNLTHQRWNHLYHQLRRNWPYTKHHLQSAIEAARQQAKSWIQQVNQGKPATPPQPTTPTMYIKKSLIHHHNGQIKISIKPNREYLVINLHNHPWIPKDYHDIACAYLKPHQLTIILKWKIPAKQPKGWAAIDINIANITMYMDGQFIKYDLRKIYHIHRAYEAKRQRIQKLAKTKPKTAQKLMEKYRHREHNRTTDLLHKLTTNIAKLLATKQYGLIMENLKGTHQNKPPTSPP